MGGEWEKLRESCAYIREKTELIPRVAVVLGSGLGGFAARVDNCCLLSYEEIPGFPASTVSGLRAVCCSVELGRYPLL